MTKVLKDLVRHRRKKKLQQAEVARRMKITRQQVYNIETMRQGHPSIHTCERYAKAIGVKIRVEAR